MSPAAALLLALAGAAALAALPPSGAALWDVVVDAGVENSPLRAGEGPVVSGTVSDHAGDPVANATVRVSAGRETAHAVSDAEGAFRHEFASGPASPGSHVARVTATAPGGAFGMASAAYEVRGDGGAATAAARALATEEAARYLAADAADFEGNPTGTALYLHYQRLMGEHLERTRAGGAAAERAAELDRARAEAAEREARDIEERRAGAGSYSGYDRDAFVDGLDPSVRGTIAGQLSYTEGLAEAGRAAMRGVLDAGGTYAEAVAAYRGAAAATRGAMDALTGGGQGAPAGNSTSAAPAGSAAAGGPPAGPPAGNSTTAAPEGNSTAAGGQGGVSVSLNGTDIRVGLSGATITLSVNGTTVEFSVNGTAPAGPNSTGG